MADPDDRRAAEIIEIVRKMGGHADLPMLVAEKLRAIRREGIERGAITASRTIQAVFEAASGKPAPKSATIHNIRDVLRGD